MDETESLIMGAKGTSGIASDAKLLKKLKAVRNYRQSDAEIVFEEYEKTNDFGNKTKTIRMVPNAFQEKVIVMDELVSKNVPMRFIRGVGPKNFGTVELPVGKRFSKLSTELNKFYSRVWKAANEQREYLGMDDAQFEKFANQYSKSGATDAYVIAKSLINGDPLPPHFTDPILSELTYSDNTGTYKIGSFFESARIKPNSAASAVRNHFGIKGSEIILGTF